jgi:hypothetical protein
MCRGLLFIVALLFAYQAKAQIGNNEVQIAVQLALPVGELSDLASRGDGGSVKGLWGIGRGPQQITAEVTYTFFDLRDEWLGQGTGAFYGGFTIYGGYRYRFGNFFAEPQAGVASYSINAYNSITQRGIDQSKAYFSWAAGGGYQWRNFELGTRYQSAMVSNSESINFVALRLGYKFVIGKRDKQRVR